MKLSIIIPCYNEVNTIEEIIEAVYNSPFKDKEIIVVDDCSTDGTREKLNHNVGLSKKITKIIYHESNKGKGYSVKSGVKEVNGDK